MANVFNSYNETLISPCNYCFPVNTTEDFFELAHTITSVGFGATIGLNERLAITDPLLVKSISSILSMFVNTKKKSISSAKHLEHVSFVSIPDVIFGTLRVAT
ncbi:hypothetical protein PSPO01_16302 [Paraphaeosphaeria sporulosa]